MSNFPVVQLTPIKSRVNSIMQGDMKLIPSAEKIWRTDLFTQLIKQPQLKANISYDYGFRNSPQEYSQLIPYEEINSASLSITPQIQQKQLFMTVRKISNPQNSTYTTVEGFKGCKCQKSKCQKKYCDCFRMGLICTELCCCLQCQNMVYRQQHERNAKLIYEQQTGDKIKGCNCSKNHCMKNYCICHSSGRKCMQSCHCQSCNNKLDNNNPIQQINGYKKIKIQQWLILDNQEK